MKLIKITSQMLEGKGVTNLPDVPGLSAEEMQAKFDELSRDVITPAFNANVQTLQAEAASAEIGAAPPKEITPDPLPQEGQPTKLSAVLQGIVNFCKKFCKEFVQGFAYSKTETEARIDAKVVDIGTSDMTMALYDPKHKGIDVTIQEYNHVIEGATHKLTGTGSNIKFVSTGNYLLGETFKVNNKDVTVKNLAGFNVGDIVFCALNNNVLDFQQNYVQVLLWQNAKPNDTFMPQTISLPEVTKYKTIMVTFKYFGQNSNVHNVLAAAFAVKGDGTFTVTLQYPFGSNGTVASRIFQNLAYGVYFGNGHKSNSHDIDDKVAIPQKIYGLRGV